MREVKLVKCQYSPWHNLVDIETGADIYCYRQDYSDSARVCNDGCAAFGKEYHNLAYMENADLLMTCWGRMMGVTLKEEKKEENTDK